VGFLGEAPFSGGYHSKKASAQMPTSSRSPTQEWALFVGAPLSGGPLTGAPLCGAALSGASMSGSPLSGSLHLHKGSHDKVLDLHKVSHTRIGAFLSGS
jgi:uncharacterized protein YjbI with pentapeptide repeats